MASDYSPLKIELIKTGEQVATWGQTTNTNLGTAIEQAIGGKADVTMSSTTRTLTLSDTNAAQDARALYLNLTGTPGGAATLNLPAVEKAYIVRNGTTGGFAVTVKVTGQTGVSVPNGATMHLYNNGTDVVNAMTNLPAGATIGGVAIGTGGGSVTSVTGTGTVNGITLTGNVTTSGSLTLGGSLTNIDLGTQVTGQLGTNRGGTGQSVTAYCNLATNVNGQLPVANGGTGAQTLTANAALIGNGTGAVLGLSPGTSGNIMTSNGTTWTSTSFAGIIPPSTSGNVLTSNGTTWTSAALPATVSSFSGGLTGLTPSVSTTGAITLGGTLGVANGGTGLATLTANNVLLGNGTSAVQAVAPGSTGNLLTSNGTTWVSSAPPTSFIAGMIMMWSGTIATIPTGWVLCNGSNGTPDLRDRFIIGASQDSGGVARTNVTGSLTQTGGSKDAIVVSHTHGFTTGSSGSHSHDVLATGGNNSGTLFNLTNGYSTNNTGHGATTGITNTAGSHTHTGTTDSTGSSGTNANLPPYYALAFIMKT